VAAFERRCRAQHITFAAVDGRMRCMPHTIHLAALKVRFSFIYSLCHSRLSYSSCWRQSVLSPKKRNRKPSPEPRHTRTPQRSHWTRRRTLKPLQQRTPTTPSL
jgi:hypothetical protein